MTTLAIHRPKTKYPRDAALAVAAAICSVLRMGTMANRLMVCGSLRRQKDQVGDVEIVYVPVITKRKFGLFDEDSVDVDMAEMQTNFLLSSGILVGRPNKRGVFTWGPQNKLAVHVASGIPVDLFATTEENWWVTVVIRTGSADHNIHLIEAAKTRGLKVHAYGVFEDIETGEKIIPASEENVFDLAGVPYVPPGQRSVVNRRSRFH